MPVKAGATTTLKKEEAAPKPTERDLYLGIRTSPELHERLARAAEKRGQTYSEVVREALKIHTDRILGGEDPAFGHGVTVRMMAAEEAVRVLACRIERLEESERVLRAELQRLRSKELPKKRGEQS